jgi:hypothetical protein
VILRIFCLDYTPIKSSIRAGKHILSGFFIFLELLQKYLFLNRGNYFEDVSIARLNELRKFILELRNILTTLKETLFVECHHFKSQRLKMLVGHISDDWIKCEKGIHKSCIDILNKIDSKVLWVGTSNNLPTPMIGICPGYDQIIEEIEEWDKNS